MPQMDVTITHSFKDDDPVRTERTITVSQEELEQFIPPPPSGGGGWAYVKEAEELICSILKEEHFPDEITPIEEVKDLQRLGVTALSFSFDSLGAGSNMGSVLIYAD